ncbi:MAG: peptidylprolyl isomerase [Pirellulales bacterium]|nr:peptidylprolyl isomerase [Pirellulales bacterium]
MNPRQSRGLTNRFPDAISYIGSNFSALLVPVVIFGSGSRPSRLNFRGEISVMTNCSPQFAITVDLTNRAVGFCPTSVGRTMACCLLGLSIASYCAEAVDAATFTHKVRFYMNMGVVEFGMYGNESPLGVNNFLNYVNNGSYNDSIIHRTRTGPTIAGSLLFAQGGSYKYNGMSIATGAPVANEFNAANGLSNIPYTLAAARGSDPNSATSGWFINQTNNAAGFDLGPYTVLGLVTLDTGIIDQIPYLNNLPILQGSILESMPIYENGEVIIERALRVPLIPGDFNLNGVVNSADYSIWRSNFGSTTNLVADANANGVVDAADYIIWRKSAGSGAAAGAGLGGSSVPEPTAGLLLLLLGLGFSLLRRSMRSTCRLVADTM